MKRFLILALPSFVLLCVVLLLPSDDGDFHTETVAAASVDTDTTTYLPLIANRYLPLFHDPHFPAPLFGLQTYRPTSPSDKYHSHLIGSQTHWVRSRVMWKYVEPENTDPDNYNWSWVDASLAAASPDAGNLHLITGIGYMPEWARLVPESANGRIAPGALDDFAEFLQATVERYDGDGYRDAPGRPVIRHWELFNEPDEEDRWGGHGTEYAAMLEVAYEAIKTADPEAQVVFGGLAYDWFDYQGGPFDSAFLDDVLSAGGGAYFDVMNFHMYPAFAPVWGSQSTGLKEKTADVRSKLAAYGLEKPIIVTEAGWHSSTDTQEPSSDEMQIARLMQMATQSYAIDIKVLIWFMLYDPGSSLPDYGLVTNDNPPVPKEAYSAFQAAVSLLGSARFEREIGSDETGVATMEAYQFTGPDGPLYVAWINPYGTSEVHSLLIPAGEATILNGKGMAIGTVVDDDGDGKVKVNITDQPVYIQVPH